MAKIKHSSVDLLAVYDQICGNDKRAMFDVSEVSCQECGQQVQSVNGVDQCLNCGIIYGNSIDTGAEWRNDGSGEDKTRCGMPIDNMLIESSYSTGMGLQYNGRCNKKIFADIQRSFIWQSQPYHERALKLKFDNITLKCQSCGITDAIIEFTQTIYYEVRRELDENSDYKRKRGCNDQGIQAAALFYAFQEDGHPKTYKEIAEIFEIDPDYVSEGIKIFKYLMSKSGKYNMKTNKYYDYIEGFCNRLHLDQSIKSRVMEVADKANELNILDSNTPTAIVAGCIYYVIIENGIASINKKTIEHYCKVSVPTITKVCDKLCQRTLELT